MMRGSSAADHIHGHAADSSAMPRTHRLSRLCSSLPTTVALLAIASSCSIERYAIDRLGDALAGGGKTFSSDDDIELVRDAVPFSLKLIETVLEGSPEHAGLLLAATKGFTQYSYAFVQQDAERMEDRDLAGSLEIRTRARRLYLRARDYGLRGLELHCAHFADRLRADPKLAVQSLGRSDVACAYWTGAAWGAAIALSKDRPELVADQPIVEALIDRALALDEGYEHGAIHTFLIAYESSRKGLRTDPAERARAHFERAEALSGGALAGPYVALAEAVSVQRQDRVEFEALLKRALAIDADAKPEWRVENLVVQRRARWLLARVDELFVE